MKILRDIAGPTGFLWLCDSPRDKAFAAGIDVLLPNTTVL